MKEVVKMIRGDISIEKIKEQMNKRNGKTKYMKFFETKSKSKSKNKSKNKY
jgi:hypothetical protein